MSTKNIVKTRLIHGMVLVSFLSISLMGCGGGSSSSQTTAPVSTVEPEAPQLTWLRGAAIPLSTVDPKASDTELAFLNAKIGNATIIGLGEATHSSSEFQKMNHRLLRYLVEHKGVTAFGIEAQFGASRDLDRYVFAGEGDAKQALVVQGFPMYVTQEMQELLQWMRTYNLDASNTKKLRIFGFDMQNGDEEIEHVISYIQSVDAASVSSIRQLYASYKPYVNGEAAKPYFEATTEFKELTKTNLLKANQWLKDRRSTYSALKGEEAFNWALQMSNVVLQNEAFQRLDVSKEANLPTASTLRDTAMADNIDWFKTQFASDSKVVVYAHNAHVNKGNYGQATDMGNTLSSRHKLNYFSLGYVFYEGGLNAFQINNASFQAYVSAPATKGSYDETFAAAGLKIAFLDMRNLSATDAGPVWLNTPHLLREHGAVWEATKGYDEKMTTLPKRFDAVIFIRNINAAKLLK